MSRKDIVPDSVARSGNDAMVVADDAFAATLVSLRSALRGYARSLSHDAAVADDLVQETLLRAWGARVHFAAGTNIKAWTFTILRNRFFSMRRRDRFVGDYDEVAASRIMAESGDQHAVTELAEVAHALGELPDDQREALRLVSLGSLSTDEAAARIGISTGTLKSRVSRKRAALRAIVAGRPTSRPSLAEKPPVPVKMRPSTRGGEWMRMKALGQPLMIG